MIPTAISRSLLLPVAVVLLAGACPLYQATYVLTTDSSDRLRIGPADDGEVILRFDLGGKVAQIPLASERMRVLDLQGKPVAPHPDVAPEHILIEGAARISDAPDGDWRLEGCAK